MSKIFITLLGLFLLAILGYYCIYNHSPIIQEDIDARTHAALASHGFDFIHIVTDGRDITLIGEYPDKELQQQVTEIVKNVYGVNRVAFTTISIEQEAEQNNEPLPSSGSTVEQKPVEEIAQAPLSHPKLEPLPEYTCQQEFNFLMRYNEIHFATNSADIDSSSNRLLSNLIDVAKQCAETNIEIAGHTNSRGSDDYNLRLSQARASSVMSYLISNGIEASRLTAVGYGETSPIKDNESEEGLAKNRRIEFNVEGLSQ